jgi:hypothetical protein
MQTSSNVVFLCRGSSCRKHKGKNKTIRRGLAGDLVIEEVRCQKICKGPVVGAEVDGTLEWFRKLAKDDLVDLRRAVGGRKLAKSLSDKRSKKRAGKLR